MGILLILLMTITFTLKFFFTKCISAHYRRLSVTETVPKTNRTKLHLIATEIVPVATEMMVSPVFAMLTYSVPTTAHVPGTIFVV